MRSVLLASALLSISGVVGLTGCGSSSGAANLNTGSSGVSGGGTTGSSGATQPNSLLNGKYAFSLTGTATSSGDPLVLAGSFTADGAGNITGGVEDINIADVGVTKNESVTGTYTIGADGRGTLNFTSISQTFKFATENGNHGQMIRFDSGAAASGSFALQTSSALSSFPQGNLVFEWNGDDLNGAPLSGVGYVSVSAGTVTGAGDVNEGGDYSQATVSGSLQAPDSNGHGTGSITYVTAGGSTTLSYDYDIISASRVLLIETDTSGATVGEADVQSGSFTAASLSGNYAFSLGGVNTVGTVAIIGQIAAGGASGSISSSDASENSFSGGVAVGSTFAGTYSLADTVTVGSTNVAVNGRFLMAATEPLGTPDNFVLYMVSPSQAMAMETDSDQVTFGEFLSQTGPPFSSSSFNGGYGINFSGTDINGYEVDVSGQLAPGGTSTLTSGTLDVNHEDLVPPTLANIAISGGSYTIVNGATGHGTMTFTLPGTSFTTFVFHFYFVSPSQVFLVETDRQELFVETQGSALSQPVIP